ncbi:MlaE family lipid ABC transporter permease subunit [Gammaproteobacteria bacterium AB-CW1]|uniref:MlaE family lipid ABC transporter permease subunit n=1 Tax=Natronospira elongata TaxID=3110268 RepID=A0AAP6MLQ2_9GAMM|nr:MlaE family lipid ABC transporter permease subunit [Gammaproteobacteria bacterium AB-CW1]
MGAPATVQLEGQSLTCAGEWRLPGVAALEARLEQLSLPRGRLEISGEALEGLDVAGARLLHRLVSRVEAAGGEVNLHLCEEHRRLLELAARVRRPERLHEPRESFLSEVGRVSWEHWWEFRGFLGFLGEVVAEFARRLLRPSTARPRRFLNELEQGGVRAVPIVAVLSFLVGLVIAYQLSTALDTYGATVFLPELLTTTMLRELGPLIVAILVAGRTASSYAAELGTMKINEEIDALRTLGISPFDMLILPKLLALIFALPLLTVLAGLSGMLGGALVNWAVHEQGVTAFLQRLPEGMSYRHFWLGLVKAPVFAAVIALIGCRQGLRVKRGAGGVGQATTRAVVQAIFAVIVINAVFSIIYNLQGL